MFTSGAWNFQLLTFLLELAGLSLAFIEVRMPDTAARLARFLGQLAAPVEELRRRPDHQASDSNLLARTLGKLLRNVLTLGTVPVFVYFAINVLIRFFEEGFSLTWFLPALVGFVVSLVVVSLLLTLLCIFLYFAVVGSSDFATRFVEGRAVGTLGILLAALGLMLEAYQLISLSLA